MRDNEILKIRHIRDVRENDEIYNSFRIDVYVDHLPDNTHFRFRCDMNLFENLYYTELN